MNTTQNWSKIQNAIKAVLGDGSRADRYIERGADGQLYLTTPNESVEQFGPLAVANGDDDLTPDAQDISHQADETLPG